MVLSSNDPGDNIDDFATSPPTSANESPSDTAATSSTSTATTRRRRRKAMSDPKRATHNLLERRRRDSIKDSFDRLRQRIPQMKTEKASRAVVLQRATVFIKQLEGVVLAQSAEETTLRREVEELKAKVLY